MCGVVGGWWKTRPGDLAARLAGSLRQLGHRGPDARQHKRIPVGPAGIAVLAHARLSIIDQSDQAGQPMTSPDGRFTLIFNGALVNYVELRAQLLPMGHAFATHSDTEVLLHAWMQWRSECLARLVGMFAFVVFDAAENTLTCVRDAFGIKPLYYAVDETSFLFGSEPRAIETLGAKRLKPDWQRCYDYLVHGEFDSNERTFFEGVRQLLPAHLMQFDLDSGSCGISKRWWKPSLEETTELSFADAAELLRSEFLRSVRLHLRSDVPVGAALSGGLDSSSLVCAMRYLEPTRELKTFSYVARGHTSSEETWIDEVNSYVRAVPHKLELNRDDVARDLDDLVRSQGEPFGTPAVFGQYRIFKLARKAGVSVTLDGQGADELFAGYDGYPAYQLMSLLDKGRPLEALRFALRWNRWPGRTLSKAWLDLVALVRIRAGFPSAPRTPDWIDSAFVRDAGITTEPSHIETTECPAGRWVAAIRQDALSRTGIPHFLRHADRASMRFSVESRVPFLTIPLAEFALGLPEHFLISSHGETKSVLREAMRDIVPERVLFRRDKVGFATPASTWLHQLRSEARTSIAGASRISLVNTEMLLKHFDQVIEGTRAFDWRPWTWVFFAKWYEQQGF